jgi:hypothetical protein
MPMRNKRLTSIVGMCEIVCHQRAFEIQIDWGQRVREARKRGEAAVVLWWEDLVTGKLSNGAYIMTLCYEKPLQRVNFLDIQLRGR